MTLVTAVYCITQQLPASENYGLTAQMRRASVSIPSNIAEGAARETTREFLRYLYIARGSLAELETQLMVCRNLNYLQDLGNCPELTNRIFAKLAALIKKLKNEVGT